MQGCSNFNTALLLFVFIEDFVLITGLSPDSPEYSPRLSSCTVWNLFCICKCLGLPGSGKWLHSKGIKNVGGGGESLNIKLHLVFKSPPYVIFWYQKPYKDRIGLILGVKKSGKNNYTQHASMIFM